MAVTEVQFRCKEYSKDPFQICENRNIKPFYLPSLLDSVGHYCELDHVISVQQQLAVADGRCFVTKIRDDDFEHSQYYTALLDSIKVCSKQKDLGKGSRIHAVLSERGLLKENAYVGTAILSMYAKCGLLSKAQELFEELPVRSVVSWSALIAGYTQHGLGEEALYCFQCMQEEGVSPNAVTFACLVKACGSMRAAKIGEAIHVEASKGGLLEKDVVVGTALMDMYAKCGMIAKAQEVFGKLPVHNVVSWSALITAYANEGCCDEALKCLGQMQDEGVFPDALTFTSTLKACGCIGAVARGKEIHAEISKHGLLHKEIELGNSLVNMYAKCGFLTIAQEAFDELLTRNVVSWSTLIAGYAQYGLSDEALRCFKQMQVEGILPNVITFASILKACANIVAVEIGEEIHAQISNRGLFGTDILLDNALVDMYAKCGSLAKALQVFNKLPARDAASWSTLMAGYAQQGLGKKALKCFEQMRDEGLSPSAVTFTVLLAACSSAGLVQEGWMYYNNICSVYCIAPSLLHHTCMVDLLSRAGHFDEAISIIKTVIPSDCLLLWMALLRACRKWVNVELGRQAFDHIIELDETYAASYVCMNNIYVDAGMQEEADKIEVLRMENKAFKLPGRCCWTDVNRNVHSFLVGDKIHPQSKFIYAKLEDIRQRLMQEGYCPRSSWSSETISADVKKDASYT